MADEKARRTRFEFGAFFFGPIKFQERRRTRSRSRGESNKRKRDVSEPKEDTKVSP